jgi:hypothetical protein
LFYSVFAGAFDRSGILNCCKCFIYLTLLGDYYKLLTKACVTAPI